MFTEENLHISEPVQFKPMLFKRQMCMNLSLKGEARAAHMKLNIHNIKMVYKAMVWTVSFTGRI